MVFCKKVWSSGRITSFKYWLRMWTMVWKKREREGQITDYCSKGSDSRRISFQFPPLLTDLVLLIDHWPVITGILGWYFAFILEKQNYFFFRAFFLCARHSHDGQNQRQIKPGQTQVQQWTEKQAHWTNAHRLQWNLQLGTQMSVERLKNST